MVAGSKRKDRLPKTRVLFVAFALVPSSVSGGGVERMNLAVRRGDKEVGYDSSVVG